MTSPSFAWKPEKNVGFGPAEQQKPRKEKRQQRLEDLCAATIRALTGNSQLRYRGHRLEQDGRRLPIRAPHLNSDVTEDDFDSFRGAADGLALRLIHSDAAMHAALSPDDPLEKMLFEVLEQLRVESLVSNDHPGIRRNIKHRFGHWCLQFHHSGMTENQIGLLLFCIMQTVWSRLGSHPPLEEIEDLIEPQRAVLAPHIGPDVLALRRNRDNQAQYAKHALAICRELSSIIDERQSGDDDADKRKHSKIAEDTDFELLLEPDEDPDQIAALSSAPQQQTEKQISDGLSDYRVFNNRYDREVSAAKLVRLELLRELREQLDRRIQRQGINTPRLSRKLSRILATPQLSGWRFGEEEGRLDARRLSQLVTSPTERRLFRQEQHQPYSDCQVWFLIDNSGSMKRHIESIAMLVDVFSRAFEQAGARSEVLGFTTGSWNGGKPFKEWRAGAKKTEPGRLNELCHIVYKNAEKSWRRARPEIAGLLKTSVFREGVDGEALLWASSRLQASQAARKILIVISDGSPMESMTHLHNNDPDYLDKHLQLVSEVIDRRGEIELMGLGVGLDLSRYYRRSLELDISQSLDNAVFDEVISLLASNRR